MCLNWMCYAALICGLLCEGFGQSGCPPLEVILPCRCLLRGEEYQIWCSHSDLPRVLEGLRAVGQYITQPIDELILENNYLPALPGRTFFSLKVMRLMLRYNSLERVSSDWLAGLDTSLMELFIVEPELRSLPDDSLLQLMALEAITIQTNLMKRIPMISGLPKLKYIQIESKSLLELSPRNFKDNPKLEKLHINMSPRLTRLEANLLRDLPSLNLINISHCGISWIHPRSLIHLPALKEISLVGNKIVDAGMVGRGIRDLLELEIIRLDNNFIDKLNEAAFVDLPALKKLYLSNNLITELNHGAFHRVPMLRSLDLNRNNLRRVHPESFLQHSGSGLEELWIVENDISHVAELRSILDALPRLIFLDMSFNNLEAIPFGALRGHPTLEYLHLDYNKIHLIDREAFMAMPALRELRLKNNSISDILEGPLWNLPALKGLDLSGNYFRKLNPKLLENLPSLRRLDISENEVTLVDPAFLLPTPELEHINISNNALVSIHPATFRHLLSLYELDLSHNRLVEFVPGLPRGIEYLHMSHNQIIGIPMLPSPDLDLPALRLLDLSDNRIQRLYKGSLRTLSQLRRLFLADNLLQEIDEYSLESLTRLETLDLQDNKIVQLHPNSLKDIFELSQLNLKNNRLDILIPDMFKHAPMLKVLDVSKNQLSDILPGTLDKNRELQVIDVSHNSLVQLSPTFYGMQKLKILDLTDNKLKHIDPEVLSSLSSLVELRIAKNFIQELKQGAVNNLQNLKILHLDHNDLEVIEPNSIKALPVLKVLKLNNNKLKELPNNAFANLPSLQIAELQENQLKSIGATSFNMVPHLLMLNLSSNRFSAIEDAGLRSLRSLEMLDISKNRLSRLVGTNLEKMEWLVELKLDDNKICGVQGSFNGMPRLRVLSLRNNKMMSFPEQAVQRLKGNIAVLDIDGNPLVCSCNLVWLQDWLQESSKTGPRCADGTLVREMRLSRQECPDEDKSLDIVAPGCEAELLSAPSFGNSQIFSQWMKLKSNLTKENNVDKNHLPPFPEESEYFYDEYVDYPYNDSTVVEPNNSIINSNVKLHNIDTLSKKSQFDNTSSSHYTAGDTPTIYAASNHNKTKLDIPKEIMNSPSTSGFTFFGVPLPSLNFNNFLKTGSVRMEDKKPLAPIITAQRKAAIVNKSQTTGRTGISSQFQHSETLNQEVLKPPPLHTPPVMPEIQTGGFKPLLPGTGGFIPIINPDLIVRSIKMNVPNKIKLTNISKNITNIEVVSTQASNIISTSIPQFTKQTISMKNEDSMGHQIPSPISLTRKPFVVFTDNNTEPTSERKLKIENTKTVTENIIIELSTSAEKYDNILDTEIITTENPYSTIIPSVVTEIVPSTNSSKIIHTNETERSKLPEKLVENNEGTSLSQFLAPGGQQPQFRQAGRSTITKVSSPHITGSSPLQSNFGIEIPESLKNNREGKNSHDSLSNDENDLIHSENKTNWYFANYNKTNMEPYIGKIDYTKNISNNSAKSVRGLMFCSSIIMIQKFIINLQMSP